MAALSHVERLAFIGGEAVVLVHTPHASGSDVFAYLRMPQERFAALSVAFEQGRDVVFSHFGEVVFFGLGKPSEGVMRFIRGTYCG